MTYCNTGEEACFCDTKKDTRNEETVEVLYNPHQCHHCAPGYHDCWQPAARAQLFEHEIRRHLKGGIGKKEDGKAKVVLRSGKVQILSKALDFGVADISTWKCVCQRLRRLGSDMISGDGDLRSRKERR